MVKRTANTMIRPMMENSTVLPRCDPRERFRENSFTQKKILIPANNQIRMYVSVLFPLVDEPLSPSRFGM